MPRDYPHAESVYWISVFVNTLVVSLNEKDNHSSKIIFSHYQNNSNCYIIFLL